MMSASEIEQLQAQNQWLVRELAKTQKELKKTHQEAKDHLVKIETLEEEIRLLNQRFFGRRSEKWPDDEKKQAELFDEAEVASLRPHQDAESESIEEPESTVEVSAHRRKTCGRRPLPKHIVREDIVHDIDEADKKCSCGCEKQLIGKEITERLEVIPAQLKVQRHIRYKYACSSCKGSENKQSVMIAPPAPQLLPKTIATTGLLAYIITNKYVDGIPLYRQQRLFDRVGIDLPRETLGRWIMSVAGKIEPLVEVFTQQIRSFPALLMDETTVQVMGEVGKENTTKSYMWVARGGPPTAPVIRFTYSQSRASSVAESLLTGYQGFVQTDGYAGYDTPCSNPAITHVGCFAHARRKFIEAQKVSKKSAQATEAISFIKKLYKAEIDAKATNTNTEAFVRERKRLVQPILESFHTWLVKKELTVLPSSTLGKAISYTLGQWPKLIRYIESPYLTPDTNRVENAIRPFVVGRKGWLMHGSPLGAYASATLYSIVETAKANGLEPYWYLRHLLTQVEQHSGNPDWESLAPWNLKKEDIKPF
jgi:transposase